MRKLLIVVLLALPTWLYSCMPESVVPNLPVPKEVVQETFDALPEVRDIPLRGAITELAPPLPTFFPPKASNVPTPPRRVVRTVPPRKPVGKHLPAHRPPRVEAPVEAGEDALPPQQGVICIFPFNLVPTCTPEPAGRQP